MRSVYYSKGSLLDLVWKMESKWFDAVEIDFTNFKKNNYG